MLRRTRGCHTSFSHFLAPSMTYRQYALSQTPRLMDVRRQFDTHRSHGSSQENAQAYPLSGYYSLLLHVGSPYRGNAPTSRSTTPSSDGTSAPVSMTEARTPKEKMAIVFGTRLAGPGRTSRYNPGEIPPESQWKTVNGVPIPPRPEEPDNCCMSGCVHCVWDDFRDEMEDWASRIEKARAKGGLERGTMDMRTAPRAEVYSASQSMDDDGGGSEANWSAPSGDGDLFSNIPVGIR